jgi:hypothetical protein
LLVFAIGVSKCAHARETHALTLQRCISRTGIHLQTLLHFSRLVNLFFLRRALEFKDERRTK